MNILCGVCKKEFRANDELLIKGGFDLKDLQSGEDHVVCDREIPCKIKDKKATVLLSIQKTVGEYNICPLCCVDFFKQAVKEYSKAALNLVAGIVQEKIT